MHSSKTELKESTGWRSAKKACHKRNNGWWSLTVHICINASTYISNVHSVRRAYTLETMRTEIQEAIANMCEKSMRKIPEK